VLSIDCIDYRTRFFSKPPQPLAPLVLQSCFRLASFFEFHSSNRSRILRPYHPSFVFCNRPSFPLRLCSSSLPSPTGICFLLLSLGFQPSKSPIYHSLLSSLSWPPSIPSRSPVRALPPFQASCQRAEPECQESEFPLPFVHFLDAISRSSGLHHPRVTICFPSIPTLFPHPCRPNQNRKPAESRHADRSPSPFVLLGGMCVCMCVGRLSSSSGCSPCSSRRSFLSGKLSSLLVRPFLPKLPRSRLILVFSFVALLRYLVGSLVGWSVHLVVGIIAGPYVTGGFDPTGWGGGEQHITDEITLELTRVVIAVRQAFPHICSSSAVYEVLADERCLPHAPRYPFWASPLFFPLLFHPDPSSFPSNHFKLIVIYLHSPFPAIGIELPKAYVKKHWKTIAFLLGPVMVYGWFVSAAIIYGIIPGVSFLSALGMLDLPPLFVHGR
jgi:hypothetical protein